MENHKIIAPGHRLTRRTFLETATAGAAAWSLTRSQMLNAAESTSITAKEALALSEQRRTELVELLSQLVGVRSHSGESAAAAQEVVKSYLAKLPYDVESFADNPSRFAEHADFMPPEPPGDGPFVNVVAKPHEGNGARVALFAHIDSHVVESGWTTDPYDAVVDDGKLYGLGSADDKGGVAAMLVAAAALSDAGHPAPIVISHHGKGGGSRGSLPVFDRLKDSGKKLDAVLYAHPAETGRGLNDIKHVVRGVIDMTLTVDGWRGKQLEIGLPDSALWADGGDALDACWRAIDHLKDRMLPGTEVNVGKLDAGDRTGSVPDRARAEIRVLFDGDHTWQSLLDSMQTELNAFTSTLPKRNGTFRLSIESAGMRTNPGAVPWDSARCLVLRHAIEAVTGKAPSSYPNHYGGDIRFPIRLLNIPAFGIGTLAGNFYGPNEWVDIDDLVRLVAVLILTTSGWTRV
ncbi:MAG: M20/M25/M40 family metallo-hydrolase [Proteobacteria bacterium]|nr:M20/M25/M40 family metallo-hydrolase [Pseudomonadota bacterium]